MYIFLICIWGDFAPLFLKRYLIRPDSSNFTFKMLQEVKQAQNVDILFLGSSHSYRSFDNRIFKNAGFTSFNLGSSSQTPIQTELLLKRYLDKLNPKIIIFEINPRILSSDGIESSIDIISNEDYDQNSFEMAIRQNHIMVYNSLIYAYYRTNFNIPKKDIENIKINSDTYINGGFVQKDIFFFKHVKYNKKYQSEIKNEQICSFRNIIKHIREHNIQLILVQVPITHSLYESYSDNDYFNRLMTKYGEYFNFNELLKLDDSLCFYDNMHLNQYGVEILDKALIDTLFANRIYIQKEEH